MTEFLVLVEQFLLIIKMSHWAVTVCHCACYSSPPCPFLSCAPLSTPAFPCVCVCVWVLFTFRNRELRWRSSAGGSSVVEFQGIFSLTSHSTRKFTSAKTSQASVSLSTALGRSFGFRIAFNHGYIFTLESYGPYRG